MHELCDCPHNIRIACRRVAGHSLLEVRPASGNEAPGVRATENPYDVVQLFERRMVDDN
jgi:hypothetical protein